MHMRLHMGRGDLQASPVLKILPLSCSLTFQEINLIGEEVCGTVNPFCYHTEDIKTAEMLFEQSSEFVKVSEMM